MSTVDNTKHVCTINTGISRVEVWVIPNCTLFKALIIEALYHFYNDARIRMRMRLRNEYKKTYTTWNENRKKYKQNTLFWSWLTEGQTFVFKFMCCGNENRFREKKKTFSLFFLSRFFSISLSLSRSSFLDFSFFFLSEFSIFRV